MKRAAWMTHVYFVFESFKTFIFKGAISLFLQQFHKKKSSKYNEMWAYTSCVEKDFQKIDLDFP